MIILTSLLYFNLKMTDNSTFQLKKQEKIVDKVHNMCCNKLTSHVVN